MRTQARPKKSISGAACRGEEMLGWEGRDGKGKMEVANAEEQTGGGM